MGDIRIVQTIPAHIRQLGDNLRPEDRREVESYGFPTNKALWRSYKSSILRKTALVDGEVAACWGCGGVPLSDVGEPWLLTTPYAEKVSPLRFVRIYQDEIFKMLQVYPKLVNFCELRYDRAIRLLENTGFTVSDPEPSGLNGALFCRFEKSR